MSICVARQPIFTASLKVFGYELFFREQAGDVGDVNADTATSETIISSFHDIGIDRVTSGRRAFVIFTERLLLQKVATLLPKDILVIELTNGLPLTDEVITACRSLREKGYMLAFDDFVLNPEYAQLMELADIVRIDLLETPVEEMRRKLIRIDKKKIMPLAKRLENNSSFELAKSAGFQLFQGKFFCKPVSVKSDATLAPSKLSCLRLMSMSMDPDVDYGMMEELIKHDVALSYRLFRVVNSAYFGLLYTVTSIKHALAILGMVEIRKWVTLISLSRLCEDKPSELVAISLTRARFLELLSPYVGIWNNVDDLFLLGLMSLMDALLDIPLEEVVKRTGISEGVSVPLLTGEGRNARLLALITFYEDGEWDSAQEIADEFGLAMDTVFKCYKDAISWAKRVT